MVWNKGIKTSKRVHRKCKYCGILFEIYESELKHHSCDFCSKECYYEILKEKLIIRNKGWLAKHNKGKLVGEKNPMWRGGRKRNENYSTLFIRKLKEEIKKRDDHTCQVCGKQKCRFNIHHIDYNKYHNAYNNLITLCIPCHAKTNHNHCYWKKKFGHDFGKKYELVIERFQIPEPHQGHVKIIRTLLSEGKNILVMLREEDLTKKNPLTQRQRLYGFEKIFKHEILNDKMIVMPMPNIGSVIYGRGVGYDFREIRFDDGTEDISATKKRKQMLLIV